MSKEAKERTRRVTDLATRILTPLSQTGSPFDWNEGVNHWSVVKSYEDSVAAVFRQFPNDKVIRYLEIGSGKGISMTYLGWAIEAQRTPDLTSLDPYPKWAYPPDGPERDGGSYWRSAALSMYKAAGLTVRQIRKGSWEGMAELFDQGESFHLIYIDGDHEGLWPLTDWNLALSLIKDGGVIMLVRWFHSSFLLQCT